MMDMTELDIDDKHDKHDKEWFMIYMTELMDMTDFDLYDTTKNGNYGMPERLPNLLQFGGAQHREFLGETKAKLRRQDSRWPR